VPKTKPYDYYTREELGLICAADIKPKGLAKYPGVVTNKNCAWLELQDGREYSVPDDPVKFLGLVEHLARKTWVDTEFIVATIRKTADAKGWKIHPF
jgi:hypothetical protein